MEEQILLDRTQCPICFQRLDLSGLMDESRWESMSVPQRVNLCKLAGIDTKHGSKSYEGLAKLSDEEMELICDSHCPGCNTDWPIWDLLQATTTPNQVEVYLRQHKEE